MKDREKFIGWSEAQRQKNLQLVINNARFLVLPWIESKGLASKILSLAARQLPNDWHSRYGFTPVLLETFVEYELHKGTCYKAANWFNVGRTAGRGKKSTSHDKQIPAKDIWFYPLRKKLRRCTLPMRATGSPNIYNSWNPGKTRVSTHIFFPM